jgi:GNAT superfamily N-acetyltransferase
MSATLPITAAFEACEARELAACFAAAPPGVRDALRLGWEWRGRVLSVWAPGIDAPMFNRAMGAGVLGFTTRDEIRELAERFAREGSPRAFIQVTPGAAPAQIRDWLAAEGFVLHNRWARLWRSTDAPPPPNGGVRIERVGRERAETFGKIFAAGFKLEGPVVDWTAGLVGLPRWRHYLAYLGDEPVGTAAMMPDDRFAWFGSAATLETARRKGVQSALLAHRLTEAARLGCAYAVLETAEDLPDKPAPSFRNTTRLGFQLAYHRENWMRSHPVKA